MLRGDGVLTSGSVVRVSPLKLSGINGDFDGSAEKRHGVGARGGTREPLWRCFSFSYQKLRPVLMMAFPKK